MPNRVELWRDSLMAGKQNVTRRFHKSFLTQRRKGAETQSMEIIFPL
jgi:hypothetical protein